MRCPECGEASDARLKYCEHCGAKMPERPQATGARPAVRPQRPSRAASEPAYAKEILDEVEEHSRPYAVNEEAPELPPEDQTDPGRSRPPYDGPKWLEHVPAHSPTVAGVGLLALALVLSVLPFFADAGVPGSLLALVAGAVLVARELREAGQAHDFTERVPEVLLRPESAAAAMAVLAAIAVRMLGFGLMPLLWLSGVGLIAWDQWPKVVAREDGVAPYFEPRRLLRMPRVVALGGAALCLLCLFAPWATVRSELGPLPGNAPVPQGPPELRVVHTVRPSDDVLYARGADATLMSGWDLPGAVLVELALLVVLAMLALRPEVERPSWARFVPAGAVGFCLLWVVLNMRLMLGPIAFIVGLGAVGMLAARAWSGVEEEEPPPPTDFDSDSDSPDFDESEAG
ncbi:zinc ribbon domain-containing protein [Pyxidicoccus parkwayensis]|uniref:Zinc ribbon domain-containing protein n=1 Tax=Pyxidicoccus parkwayensis TaxID=2813578 RepID=A0ABX7P979_9BACT|nr:zinc ribbon domain-containing protein [Pyxidicoccus parkwaysis]QSQ26987.1 zinc ribbon domain-containing protein [Pyxidicoccus parkwaysis]